MPDWYDDNLKDLTDRLDPSEFDFPGNEEQESLWVPLYIPDAPPVVLGKEGMALATLWPEIQKAAQSRWNHWPAAQPEVIVNG